MFWPWRHPGQESQKSRRETGRLEAAECLIVLDPSDGLPGYRQPAISDSRTGGKGDEQNLLHDISPRPFVPRCGLIYPASVFVVRSLPIFDVDLSRLLEDL